MSSPDVLIVMGTRPEAIKLAPVVHELKRSGRWRVRVCATGQHGTIAQDAMRWFELTADMVLRQEQPSTSLPALLVELQEHLLRSVVARPPDLVVVQGDTISAVAAAQVAYYARIPVAHVEAGLRTHDCSSPWPEETNRRIIGEFSTFHFCPSLQAQHNLLMEGTRAQIAVVGNTGVDAVLWSLPRLRRLEMPGELLNGPLCLVTTHRRESIESGLECICRAVLRLASELPRCRFVVPLHPNPQVNGKVRSMLQGQTNIELTAPLAYATVLRLLLGCKGVLTDSGGLQEDAVTLNRRSIVLRGHTERPEGIGCGLVAVAGLSTERIVELSRQMLNGVEDGMRGLRYVYGDGRAAQRIERLLAKTYGLGKGTPTLDEFVPDSALNSAYGPLLREVTGVE